MLDNLVPSDMSFLTTDKVCAAYILTHCKTGRKYIGSSGQVGTRLSGHKSDLKKNKHHVGAFQEDYNDDPFYDIVVYTVGNREDAYKLEQALIDKYYPTGILYNKTSNAKAPMLGRVPDQAERERVGAMNRGKKFSPVWCERISKSLTGKTWTDQQRERFIKNRTGIPISDDHREHLDRLSDSRKKMVSGDGVTYKGLVAAAEALGVHKDNIRNRIRSHLPKWANWYYI